MELMKLLSAGEKRRVRKAVLKELERYRIFNSIKLFVDEIESADSLYTTEQKQHIKDFCKRTERAIEQLADIERQIITARYTSVDSDYLTDFEIYENILNPSISETTYTIYRDRAFVKLAYILALEDSGLF